MRHNRNERTPDEGRQGNRWNKAWFRRALTAALCLSAVCLLTACGKGGGSETTGTVGTSGVGEVTETVTEEVTTAGTDNATTAGTSGTGEVTETVTEEVTTAGTDNATTAGDPETTAPETETETEGETTAPVPPEDYQVSEQDGVASVHAPSGLSYTVSGYEGREGASFRFVKGLKFSFDQPALEKEFNRFSLTYKASAPMKIYVTYEQNGKAFRDTYFLEAGEHVFSGLSIGYAAQKSGKAISALEVDTCQNKSAELLVANLTSESIEFYKDTYFLENERFKVGVDIQWGGTVNYIGDKTHKEGGLTNLINRADEGRLVQQSYYGTAGVPGVYEPGEFNHSKWSYNPVQGGDKHGNNGRLIDIVVKENSVYIKAQPQDWSLKNKITPSYAENTYTVTKDTIRVDNRFVDFSGWEHPFRHQELPAFYTVSYLNTFYWYDGSKPWSDEKVSFRDDLKFWGDPKYSEDCRMPMKQSNTETWGAFVNKEVGYGIGLYVPNIDMLYAGRFNFNDSPNPKDSACGYIAPLNTMKLVSFEPLEYSYLITTGSVEEIRSTFKTNKDFASNESLHRNYQSMRVPDKAFVMDHLDFTDPDAMSVLSGVSFTEMVYDETEKAVKLALTGADPYVNLNFVAGGRKYAAADYTKLRIEYMIPADLPADKYSMDVFMNVGDVSFERTRYDTIADGQYHVLEIDLTKLPYWKGNIGAIRLDYFADAVDGGTMFLKSFHLTK